MQDREHEALLFSCFEGNGNKMEDVQEQAQSIADDLAFNESLPGKGKIRTYTLHDVLILCVRVENFDSEALRKMFHHLKASAVSYDDVIEVFILDLNDHEKLLFLMNLAIAEIEYIDMRQTDLADLVELFAGNIQKPERLHLVGENRFYDDQADWCDEHADKLEAILDEMDKDQFWRGDQHPKQN